MATEHLPRYALNDKRVFVAGHRGMVGSALVRRLSRENCAVLTSDRSTLNLQDRGAVFAWMKAHRPHVVMLAAARVGGIHANNVYPVEFLRDNLLIELNVIDAAHEAGVEKLLFLGSSCIYPKLAPQPISEDMLLTGALEPTNEWYAIAKIAGLKLCQAYRKQFGADYISCMPTNLYGPNDNYHPENSHVLPALVRRFHEAKCDATPLVTVWGSGTPRREFLHADDLADACVHLVKFYSDYLPVNIGCGEDVTIRELARLVAKTVGYGGEIVFDASKPDGAPRKLLNVTRLTELGWRPAISLEQGLANAYADFMHGYVER